MKKLLHIKERLNSVNRFPLCYLPTPMERLNNLSSHYGGKGIYIKREDQTGLAQGGNKSRKLEFMMADVLNRGSQSIITWGGYHSNWCRQVAAAAKKAGIKPVLILFKKPSHSDQYEGNVLLDFLLNSEMHIIPVQKNQKIIELKDIKNIIEPILLKEHQEGNNPYLAPIGGSLPEGSMIQTWGAISYVQGFIEILEQAAHLGINFDSIVLASGSASTQAGLLVGAKILNPEIKIIGISVSEDKDTMHRYILNIARKTYTWLNIDFPQNFNDIIIFDEYLQEGYGILNQQVVNMIRLLAEREGILLDPVYTGKAMVGFDDLIARGYISKDKNTLFLHTGGLPSLFSYGKMLQEYVP